MTSESFNQKNATANIYDSKKTSWLFTEEEMNKIPSLLDGLTKAQELKLRQQAAGFIQDMGERLNNNVKDPRGKISQLCMCAAMLHMHRFFVVHSFRMFDPRDIAAACLFLAGKCEECPRKLEHIVKVWYFMKNDGSTTLPQEEYEECADYIRLLEGVALQTIGFDLQVEVPHSIVLKAMNKIAPNNNKLTETAYWFATDILHMTDWCVRYRIPPNQKGDSWYTNFDPDMTESKLHELADAFTEIYKTCGEALAIKRFANKNGSRQPIRSQPQEAPNSLSNTAAHLPPPPPAPILEQKQKKVGLSEYKERHRQNADVHERPIDPQTNEMQKRKSFIPDFSNASSLEMNEITLPAGIPISTNSFKSNVPSIEIKGEKPDVEETKPEFKPSTSQLQEGHRETKKRSAEHLSNSPKRKPHDHESSRDSRREREKEKKERLQEHREKHKDLSTSSGSTHQDVPTSSSMKVIKAHVKYERIDRNERSDKNERTYRRMDEKKPEKEISREIKKEYSTETTTVRENHQSKHRSRNQQHVPSLNHPPPPTLPNIPLPPIQFSIPPPPPFPMEIDMLSGAAGDFKTKNSSSTFYPPPVLQQTYSRYFPAPQYPEDVPPPPPLNDDLEEGYSPSWAHFSVIILPWAHF
uniref:Cyclin N-terminal domain-containing protein n=1 Tax=Acrobeloides nanus TaxID=290746 RepID=A0A914DVR0_9BILA